MLVNELKKSFLVSLWFMFLTFPIMVIRVNTVENIIQWRWANLFFVGIGSFVLSALWRYLIRRKEHGNPPDGGRWHRPGDPESTIAE